MLQIPKALLQIPHQQDIPFARLTTLGLGGLCRWLFEPVNEQQAQDFVRICHQAELPFRVLGAGSNILALSDIEEPVLRLNLGSEVVRKGNEIEATASHGQILLAEKAAQMGLSGLEWSSGIPGRMGGALRMNAGAHGGEWRNVLSRYRFLMPDGELIEKAPEEGEFSYRWSHLKEGKVLLRAWANLSPTDENEIRARMDAYRQKRLGSQPKGRSAGCIFKNPPGRHAGQLVDECGLKGLRVGEAMVSLEHGNFLLNLGQATVADYQALIDRVRQTVEKEKGVRLEFEVEVWPTRF